MNIDNHILVDKGALQMIRNSMLRMSEELGRPALKEMVEELNKTCICVKRCTTSVEDGNEVIWKKDE